MAGTVHGVRTTAAESTSRGTVIDRAAETVVDRFRGPRRVQAARKIARSGDLGAVWLLTFAALATRNPKSSTKAVLILTIGAAIVNGPLKSAIRRDRPEPLADSTQQPRGSSFPSGHAYSSWLAVGMLPGIRPLKIAAATMATTITLSRVYLRYHHLSDVLAGTGLGWLSAKLARKHLHW